MHMIYNLFSRTWHQLSIYRLLILYSLDDYKLGRQVCRIETLCMQLLFNRQLCSARSQMRFRAERLRHPIPRHRSHSVSIFESNSSRSEQPRDIWASEPDGVSDVRSHINTERGSRVISNNSTLSRWLKVILWRRMTRGRSKVSKWKNKPSIKTKIYKNRGKTGQ